MKSSKFSVFIVVFVSNVFLVAYMVNAQADNTLGAFCTKQSDCSAGYICDIKQNRCLRDFGFSDTTNLGRAEEDLRGQVKTYTSKMLGIPFVILLGALVGMLFLIKRVFGKNSKANIVKKMLVKILVVTLTIFIVISLIVVGYAWIITQAVLDTVQTRKEQPTERIVDSNAGILTGIVQFTGTSCLPETVSGQKITVPPCDGPYPGYGVKVYKSDGKTIAITITSDADGRYTVTLPSGKYVIYTQQGPLIESIRENVAIILGDKKTTLDLVIDTGVR